MSSRDVDAACIPSREVELATICGIVSLFATVSDDESKSACGKSISVTSTQSGINVDQVKDEFGKKEETMLLKRTKLEKTTKENMLIAAASQKE